MFLIMILFWPLGLPLKLIYTYVYMYDVEDLIESIIIEIPLFDDLEYVKVIRE